jgi:hypothetical protein
MSEPRTPTGQRHMTAPALTWRQHTDAIIAIEDEAAAINIMDLADVLHEESGNLAIEGIMCWCRRIATADGTHDGLQDKNWTTKGEPYNPSEWGESAERPTYCEQTAKLLLEHIEEKR